SLLEQLCLGVLRNIFSDVQFTKSAVTLCVRGALWDALTVEVSQLFNEVNIIENIWTLWASSNRGVLRWNRLTGWACLIALVSYALALLQYYIQRRHMCT